MPVSDSDFDMVLNSAGDVPGRRFGFPGAKSLNLDYSEGNATISGNSIGRRNSFDGDIFTGGTDRVKASFFGTPIRVFDNDSGLIPSTMFTPIPAFMATFDPVWIELAILATFTAALAVVGISDTESFFDEGEQTNA